MAILHTLFDFIQPVFVPLQFTISNIDNFNAKRVKYNSTANASSLTIHCRRLHSISTKFFRSISNFNSLVLKNCNLSFTDTTHWILIDFVSITTLVCRWINRQMIDDECDSTLIKILLINRFPVQVYFETQSIHLTIWTYPFRIQQRQNYVSIEYQ